MLSTPPGMVFSPSSHPLVQQTPGHSRAPKRLSVHPGAMDCVDPHLSCRCRQVIRAKCTLPRTCSLHTHSYSQWGPSCCTPLKLGCSTVCSGSKEESKGAIRQPRRNFLWPQQHKTCEITTHDKISLTDRRAQVCHHLGGETPLAVYTCFKDPS